MLYEGRQIYFGNIHAAKRFFVDLGFECLPRQVTADFLTSLTNPLERRVRPAFEGKTPVTPDEFAVVWKQSGDHALLMREIEEFDKQYPLGGPSLDDFKKFRRAVQAKSQYVKAIQPNSIESHLFTLPGASSHRTRYRSRSRWHCVFDGGL